MHIIFATNNENKLKEIRDILGKSFELISLGDLNLEKDIPEDGATLEENSLFKARYIHKSTGMNVFADDTGLEIEALNGQPGVHSARFAGEEKNSGANIEKVLSLLVNIENRKARFRTVIALIFKGKEYLFEGTVFGKITKEKRGSKGFGYDPVFIPEGENITFAEMSLDKKNSISHRAKAFEELKEFLSLNESSNNKTTF
jgi:XTP/dITP diphosphohydrolase